jgi:V/A-type H+-transporting ATPase subunit F
MKFERIAVIAERELALGFKLIGVNDSFIADGNEAVNLFMKFMDSKTYNLIMVSESVKMHMSSAVKRLADSSMFPLVVFIPLPGKETGAESIEVLAKTVLGVDIKGLVK